MKLNVVHSARWLTIVLILCSACQVSRAADNVAGDFPYPVPFELGATEFAPGDTITIQEVRGTSEAIAVGQTYCVIGTYTLGSREEADLSLLVTATSGSGASKVDPNQTVRISRGAGSFRLIKSIAENGYLHLTFYPVSAGGGFGGLYFGQGAGVLRNKGFSPIQDSTWPSGISGAASATGAVNPDASQTTSSAEINRSLLEYLGDPVQPPANLDAAYTKEGLMQAAQLAAGKAGLSIKAVLIDDSEFPFLIGVICPAGGCQKLKPSFQTMEGYAFSGSVDSDTRAVFNLVPWTAVPAPSVERIHRRLMLREQVFYDKIRARE